MPSCPPLGVSLACRALGTSRARALTGRKRAPAARARKRTCNPSQFRTSLCTLVYRVRARAQLGGVQRSRVCVSTRALSVCVCAILPSPCRNATSAQAPLTPGGSYGTAEGKHRDTPVAAAPGSHPIDARLIEEPDATLRAKVWLAADCEWHAGCSVPYTCTPACWCARARVCVRMQEAEGRVVSVRGLRKEFDTPDGIKTAVDGINMTMYEGQIFVLLGHNGAGKSTTINMLTGMMEPTAGNMSVFGKDVSSQLSAIREDMGVCPQHDVLWPELTVKEHLRLYADIKGIPYNKVNEEIDNAIRTVGLTEKVDVQSRKLSGGQRRKLSVCIALMGGSRVIFLDEPTSGTFAAHVSAHQRCVVSAGTSRPSLSRTHAHAPARPPALAGMDPYSRRSTWQILQNNRAGRVMVLTTHFMDEADLLGDRIAIMAQGRVQCCGNPMFLKNAYGVGYVLTIVKEPLADSAPLLALVKRHVPDVTVSTDVGAELALRVPMASSRAFPQLFAELDAQQAALHFVAYGVGITTMEEVFLKVAEVEAEHPHRATTVAKPSFMQRASTCFRAKPSATAPTSGSGTVTVANAAAPVPASPTAVTVHRKASTPTAAASAVPPAHGQFGAAAL
ncbi:ATP-binding cassette domain-containing protein, partial [archaeon]